LEVKERRKSGPAQAATPNVQGLSPQASGTFTIAIIVRREVAAIWLDRLMISRQSAQTEI
jgi:hypothetical protein